MLETSNTLIGHTAGCLKKKDCFPLLAYGLFNHLLVEVRNADKKKFKLTLTNYLEEKFFYSLQEFCDISKTISI